MIKSLNPKLLTPENPSYKAVEELSDVIEEALKEGEIKNVALTGPFGSGKSSILLTLRKNFNKFEYLPISLATLKSEEDLIQEKDKAKTSPETGNPEEDTEKVNKIEIINRRIEYSILQQLIYREKMTTVPNSRLRRIIHISDEKLSCYSWYTIGLLLAVLIVLFPDFYGTQSFLKAIGIGRFISFLKFCGFLYILHVIYLSVKSFVRTYSNSKLNKLNLKDMYIEIKEENSIFNKYLDEILYFFQVTKYNVVIIEDLDRFGTSDIFLKLRELNQLLNESKVVNRNIVFIYAVKDDIFLDEERTKFFDYITTVIPVINPSNSKDKLLEALKERGLKEKEIDDVDLREIAFFIQDMRILTNIANEFQQYREKLCTEKNQNLNLTKLLAMIVYKNYHPKDFAMLHRRDGKVFSCIKEKDTFVKGALVEFELKEKALEVEYQEYLKTRHLKEADLRLLYLYKLKNHCTSDLRMFIIKNNEYTLETIAEDEELFNTLISSSRVEYTFTNYSYNNRRNSKNVDLEDIDKTMQFKTRMALLKDGEKEFDKKRARLRKAKLSVHRFKLSALIRNYKQGNSETYKQIGLSEMMDVFIRRGFIDEEYYDYISFFYEGMVSLADRELLLSIKRDIAKEYSYHIDKVENFVKELLPYMFETQAILNNDLLDFVALFHDEYFDQMMYLLEKDNAPLDFLAQYYHYGKQQKLVYEHYIKWNERGSWINIESWKNDDEKNTLIEGWLKYSKKICKEARGWLNNHYEFLTERFENIGKNRCLDLVVDSEFKKLNNNNPELLRQSIDNHAYEINSNNLCLIVNFFCNDSQIEERSLNLSRIRNTKNNTFVKHIESNIDKAILHFSMDCKDEAKDSILFILNNEKINFNDKADYLARQKNLLDNDNTIVTEKMKELAYSLLLINPTWKNVLSYYSNNSKDENILIKYIEHFSEKLGSQIIEEENNEYISLRIYLLGSNRLTISAYSSIIESFNGEFKGYGELKDLEQDRLNLLLSHNMLPFCEENADILKETDIYADYLIKYHKQLLESISTSLIPNSKVAYKLLTSNVFTYEEKKKIISCISINIFTESDKVANLALVVIKNTDLKEINENTVIRIIKNASIEPYKVYIISLLILEYNYDESKITELLNLLGGKYTDIAERTKRPLLDKKKWNIILAEVLKNKGFISSVKEEKDGIRIHPRKNVMDIM